MAYRRRQAMPNLLDRCGGGCANRLSIQRPWHKGLDKNPYVAGSRAFWAHISETKDKVNLDFRI
jgi:hypothetical protein